MEFSHYSVLLSECIEGLNIKENGIYIDGTAGGAGHSREIAKRLTTGRLVAIDQDAEAIRTATERLAPYGERATVVRSNFSELGTVCDDLGIDGIDGLLLDLGCSSRQFDEPMRGFSYQHPEAPLNMRMDDRNPLTAAIVLNTYSEEELKRILWLYGEEKFAGRIARLVCEARETKPLETTGEFVDIIKRAIPAKARDGGHHPAKRSFQAIRIAVNGELDVIAPAIESAAKRLNPGGRIVIISFQSLEDRIVKETYRSLAEGCTCPKSLPICVCGNKPTLKLVNRKPILPSERELEENPRSRSAKLRIAERI
ncbi:MAG: 16S rRNA (cytosine(1402)-N(4))-methyltransferase RsmH [Clostridia bacterium]|nr:16S rRNA (cytosine(1402)-N(4))-methyltransferase RsmH [Clostridia bacterium]